MAFGKVLSQLLCYAAKVVSPPCLRSSMSLACHLIWEEEEPCLRAQFIPRGRWHGWEGSCSLSYPFPSSSQSHLHSSPIPILMLSDSYPHPYLHPYPPPTAAGCAPNPRSTGGNAGSFGAGTVARATTEQPIQPIAADRASRHCRKEIFHYLGVLCLSQLMLGRANDAPHMASLLPAHHQKIRVLQELQPQGQLARRNSINPTETLLFIEPEAR